jgi:hypothetical protein
MNEPKSEVIPQQGQTDAETGGTPPGGGRPDESMGGTDNTTADTVEAAKEAADMKKKRG